MPTLVAIDSFQHQVLRTAQLPVGAMAWYVVSSGEGSTSPTHDGTRVVFDETQPRTADHACSMKVTHSATTGQATQVHKTFAGGAITVVSFYIRCTAAPTTASFNLFQFGAPTNGLIGMTTNGYIRARVGAGTWVDHNVNVCDGNWHRIDAKYDRTTTSGTLDVQVDGSALTQATGTVTTGNATDWNFGGTSIEAAAYDVWYSDLVVSNTSGDYPIGDHIVKALEINATGTHSQGSGAFTDEAGGTSDAALLAAVDDAWDGTTPNLTQTGEDYVQQTANDGGGYVEFGFENPTEDTIWDVQGITLMAAEDSTTAGLLRTTFIANAQTLGDTGAGSDPSISSSAYTGYRVMMSRPTGGWDNTKLSGATVRAGYSIDTNPDGCFNSALLEYASPWTAAGNADVTPSTVTGAASTFAPTTAAASSVTPTTVSRTATVETPVAQMHVYITTTTVVGTATVNAPTVSAIENVSITTTTVVGTATAQTPSPVVGNANAPPDTVVATATIETPTVETPAGGVNADVTPDTVIATATTFAPVVASSSSVTPDAVTGTASAFGPTVVGNAALVTEAVPGIASVPPPVLKIDVVFTLTTFAGSSLVNAPTFKLDAVLTVGDVSRTTLVSTPPVAGGASTTAGDVVGTASVFVPTFKLDAVLTPLYVEGLTSIPAPNVTAGGANASVTFLDPPQNLVAVAVSSSQIDLDWDVVTGATRYLIERDGIVIEFNHPTNSYSDMNLDPGTLYIYRVKGAV